MNPRAPRLGRCSIGLNRRAASSASERFVHDPCMTTDTTSPVARGSRAGVIALVLGIVAVVFAIIPFLSYIAWAIGIAAIIVGIVALTRRRLLKRGGAITGIVLGAIAVVLSIVLSVVYTTVFFLASVASNLATTAPTDLPSSGPSASSTAAASPTDGQDSVTYRVTGSGRATSITYLTADSSGSGTDQVSNRKLPWKKTVAIKDTSAFSTTVFSLVAQTGASGGRVTCEIEADGKVISKHSSSGAYTVVSCSGSAG